MGRLWAEERSKCDELKPQQWKLLEDHWNGALQQHYENAVSARGLQGHQVSELFWYNAAAEQAATEPPLSDAALLQSMLQKKCPQ